MTFEDKAIAYTAAWNSGDPAQVAGHFTPDGQIQINRGDILKGTQALTDMAAGFHTEFPDLALTCDAIRTNGDHAVYMWTLEGHHTETKNFVKASGWEEWDLDGDQQIIASKGWFDAETYQAQIDGVA